MPAPPSAARIAAFLLAFSVTPLLGEDIQDPSSAGTVSDNEGVRIFEQVIRPTLLEHCYQCHSEDGKAIEAGLRVDDPPGLRSGGDSGAAVVPGAPDESLLLSALSYESFEMPPDRKLPQATIAAFRRWIELGAPDPREERQPAVSAETSSVDWQVAKQFWAFQPPAQQRLPNVSHGNWPKRRHDYFILQGLEDVGLAPSPVAAPVTLRRRLWIDLLGMPPTEAELVDADLPNDEISYARLVDQLLDRVEFGERWARLWLDLARYAEDQAHIVGDNKSLFYPNAFLYRDWVIQAWNSDMPFDRFVTLQLAADLVDEEEHRVALGFIGLGPKYYDRGRLEVKAEEWEDRVDTVSRTLLGLTVACARCHDHKYDPIPTSDYYALASVFASTEMFNCPLPTQANDDSANNDASRDTDEAQEKPANERKPAKTPEQSMHIVREGKPTDLQVFIRGNVHAQGDQVSRGFLSVLSDGERLTFEHGSGRRELAAAIVHPDNPLTARVFVNRVWNELTGHHLVGTPSNFGTLGQRPTHPELLDDLAVRFMQNGWSLKWLVREIVTSSTYRQTSQASVDQMRADPENTLLGRMTRKRLRVEAWRDSLLVASGRLERTLGGPSMRPDDPESRRRTVYSEVSRFQLNPMLATFDFPDANVHASKRNETTTPTQKLFVMNHPFVLRQAEALGAMWHDRFPVPSELGVDRLYQRVLSRSATAEECRLGKDFVQSATEPDHGWQQLAHALLASNEMFFLD